MSDRPKLSVLYPTPDEHDDESPAEKEERKHCLHRKVKLDTEARRVFCRECDREVDAFTVILAWANDWTRITYWRKEAERRRARAGDRLEEILRVEKNARARVKKLDPQAKLPEKPWGDGNPI